METLKSLRKEAGFATQADFATALGIKRATVAKWESGENCPKTKDLHTIAKELKTTEIRLIDALSATRLLRNQSSA